MVLLAAHRVPAFLSLLVLGTKLTSHPYLSLAATTEPLMTSNTTPSPFPHREWNGSMARGLPSASAIQDLASLFGGQWREGSLPSKDKRVMGGVMGAPHLLQQQHGARPQLTLVCLQKRSVHCSKHLSCKVTRSQGQAISGSRV